jgi:hypothetical protein
VTLLVAAGAISILAETGLVGSFGCNIKGNINDQGERIYHVPGQKYYDKTVITFWRGERWFCSEAEAQKAGWRRSRV